MAGLPPEDLTGALDGRDAAQPGPAAEQVRAQPLHLVGHPHAPGLDAAVPAVGLLGRVVAHAREPVQDRLVQQRLDLGVQRRLVLLDRQHVGAPGLVDLPRHLLLTARRVDRHGRARQVQQRQQARDRLDLVALVRHRQLAEDQVIRPDERADQVGHAAPVPGVLEAAADRLAVDRDQPLAARRLRDRTGPGHEAPLERVGVQVREHPAERVVAGDAAGQVQNVLNHASLLLPNTSTSAQPPAPQITAQIAITRMSCSLWITLCARGSGRSWKKRTIPPVAWPSMGKLLLLETRWMKRRGLATGRM